ncbi:MAG: hypothetical protein HYY17_15815 [Planctomycetes bacterium]|nr:hypothetical protein [Planctomycetota bacterium]
MAGETAQEQPHESEGITAAEREMLIQLARREARTLREVEYRRWEDSEARGIVRGSIEVLVEFLRDRLRFDVSRLAAIKDLLESKRVGLQRIVADFSRAEEPNARRSAIRASEEFQGELFSLIGAFLTPGESDQVAGKCWPLYRLREDGSMKILGFSSSREGDNEK